MAAANDSTQLAGLFKPVFASEVVKTFPSVNYLQERLGLQKDGELGDYFLVPVALQVDQGFTYAASSGESGPPTLNASIAGNVLQAQVKSYQIILRSRISYAAASKAAAKGAKAFEQSYAYTTGMMKAAMEKRCELTILQGQRGLGKVSSASAGVLTMDTTTWSPGTWAGLVGAVLEAWDGNGSSQTQHNGDLTITKVDIANKKITVSGTSGSVTTGDYLYFKGARTASAYNEGPGLMVLVQPTTGTLFNITNVQNYDTFQAQQLAITGNLSFSNIMTLSMASANYGMAEDTTLLVAPRIFAELATDQAALRREDSSYSQTKSKRGSKGITFQSGVSTIEVVAHPYMWESEATLLAFDHIRLVGSSKPTFGINGLGDLAVQVTDTAAVEIRQFSDMSPVILQPALCGYISGIT